MRTSWILAMALMTACRTEYTPMPTMRLDPAAAVLFPVYVAASMPDCGSTTEVRCVTAERLRQHHAREEAIIAKGRSLAHAAGVAARAGDCAQVRQLEVQVNALPAVHLEGGIHDTVFLRDTEVARCVSNPAGR